MTHQVGDDRRPGRSGDAAARAGGHDKLPVGGQQISPTADS
jgi:hypothetical protein